MANGYTWRQHVRALLAGFAHAAVEKGSLYWLRGEWLTTQHVTRWAEAEGHKLQNSHSCNIAQGVLHAVQAPAGYVRLLAGCACVQAAIEKSIVSRWRHMLQSAR